MTSNPSASASPSFKLTFSGCSKLESILLSVTIHLESEVFGEHSTITNLELVQGCRALTKVWALAFNECTFVENSSFLEKRKSTTTEQSGQQHRRRASYRLQCPSPPASSRSNRPEEERRRWTGYFYNKTPILRARQTPFIKK